MKRAEVLEELERCVSRDSNALWHGLRALQSLPAGIDRRLVERAMRVVLPHTVETCRKLPEEYVPIAWRVLATLDTPPATFLCSFASDDDGECLRDGCAWLEESTPVNATPRGRRRIQAQCENAKAVAAAQATVVKHGLKAKQLVAILAHEASDASIDALVEVIHRALESRDASLDLLDEWLVPFAHGRLESVVDELGKAIDARGQKSPVLALAARFGSKQDRFVFELAIESKQVRVGFVRKATARVRLRSHALPNAKASITWNVQNFRWTRWEDGVLKKDELELGGPRSQDDIPRWLAASAKQLRVTWDLSTVRVTSTLRNKARAAAIAWITTVPKPAYAR